MGQAAILLRGQPHPQKFLCSIHVKVKFHHINYVLGGNACVLLVNQPLCVKFSLCLLPLALMQHNEVPLVSSSPHCLHCFFLPVTTGETVLKSTESWFWKVAIERIMDMIWRCTIQLNTHPLETGHWWVNTHELSVWNYLASILYCRGYVFAACILGKDLVLENYQCVWWRYDLIGMLCPV